MLGSSKAAFVACLLSLCLSGFVNAVPMPDPVLMAPRQATTPTTVTTTDTIETSTGPMLQTCEITLTPDSDGSYQEVKSCSLSAISAVSSGSGAEATSASPVAVVGASSIDSTIVFASGTAAASVVASVSSAAAATSAAGAIDNAGGASASASAPSVSKTAVANAAVTFTIPGRHILILPVGLVVFCVITGIMLLVIVFQHFERMRYRRAFRQRKLAEQGAAMGYGGTGKM